MRCRLWVSWLVVCSAALLPRAAVADTILLGRPSRNPNWVGTQARLTYYAPDGTGTTVVDTHASNAQSSTGLMRWDYYFPGGATYTSSDGLATVAPYEFGGWVHAGVNGPTLQADTYFRDEIYYRSNQAGYLAFDFDVHYSLSNFDIGWPDNLTKFQMELWAGDWQTGTLLDRYSDTFKNDVDIPSGQPQNTQLSYDKVVTLTTRGPYCGLAGFPCHELGGGYHDFTFVVSAFAQDGSVAWFWDYDPMVPSRIGALQEIRVLDLSGNPIDRTNYSLSSAAAVPEPASLLLVGAGLLGLCARRRRQR